MFLGDDSVSEGEEEYMMVPYSRNEISSDDRKFEVTAMVSRGGGLKLECEV